MKIEIERDVVQNALEALQYAHATNRYENTRQEKAIKELRKALASPTEMAETLLMPFDSAPFVQAQGCLSGVSVPRPATLEQQIAVREPLTDKDISQVFDKVESSKN